MHAAGLQSALAIRRQRKRRDEQKRAKERRYSIQSTESGLTSPRGSMTSLERASRRAHRMHRTANPDMLDTKVSSIGMLHIGIVFLVLGLFLIGSGLLPNEVTSWGSVGSTTWWNELICTGLFAVAVGVFLIILNKYISKKEDEDLEEYVQSQLTRSRSGNRLERDVETGGMITKHMKREKRLQKEGEERGFDGMDIVTPPMSPRSPPATHETAPTHPHHGFINPVAMNGDVNLEHHLDQIVEEDYSASEKGDEESKRMEFFNKETYSTYSNTTSMGSVTPSDTRELLHTGRHIVISRM